MSTLQKTEEQKNKRRINNDGDAHAQKTYVLLFLCLKKHTGTYVLMFLCLKKLLPLFYHPVEPHIQQRPERDIRQQHQRVVHVADGHHRKHEEARRHQLDGHHGPAGRETHCQKLMMDVRLVRQEQRLPVARTPQVSLVRNIKKTIRIIPYG